MRMTRCNAALCGLMAALLLSGCAAVGRAKLTPQAPPPYTRTIMLVLERENFTPVSGAEIRVETEAPTRLAVPVGASGRTDARGALELVFAPLPHYDQSAWAGGDLIVEYPIKAKLIIERANRPAMEVELSERETFASYADPLYQALNRDPERGLTYYTVTLP